MKRWLMLSMPVAVSLALAAGASAQGKKAKKAPEPPKAEEAAQPGPTPEEVTTGELRMSLSADYVKVKVDGAEWEEHEFLDNGKTLVIHTMKRTEDHVVSLAPVSSDLAPQDVTVKPDDWKLVTVDKAKNLKMWRAEKKVTFERVKGK